MEYLLTEDCWLEVLKYLKFQDHLRVALVSPQMMEYVSYFWRTLKSATVNEEELKDFDSHPELRRSFLENASTSLEDLEVFGLDLLDLRRWQRFPFSNLRNLHCEIYCDSRSENYERIIYQGSEEIRYLVRVFPNITKLRLVSNVSGRYLWRFRKLLDLDLGQSKCVMHRFYKAIFTTLNLQKLTMPSTFNSSIYYDRSYIISAITLLTSLEELVADFNYPLTELLPHLLQLQSFRKLTFYFNDDFDWVLNLLTHSYPQRVEMLHFHRALTFFDSHFYPLPNCRRMIFVYEPITFLLFEVCEAAQNLQELHLIKAVIDQPRSFWELVARLKSLMLLNLAHSMISEDFLRVSQTIIQNVLNERCDPLVVNFYSTGLVAEEVEEAFKDTKVRAVFTPQPMPADHPPQTEQQEFFSFLSAEFAPPESPKKLLWRPSPPM